jgi:exodeoxyribonuclease-1
VDQGLYQGGFFSDGDRRRMEQVRQAGPQELARLRPAFEDPRLDELLFRYRSRNWPETLSPEEKEFWRAFRRQRIYQPDDGIGFAGFLERVGELRADPQVDPGRLALLDELEAYARQLAADLEPGP